MVKNGKETMNKLCIFLKCSKKCDLEPHAFLKNIPNFFEKLLKWTRFKRSLVFGRNWKVRATATFFKKDTFHSILSHYLKDERVKDGIQFEEFLLEYWNFFYLGFCNEITSLLTLVGPQCFTSYMECRITLQWNGRGMENIFFLFFFDGGREEKTSAVLQYPQEQHIYGSQCSCKNV